MPFPGDERSGAVGRMAKIVGTGDHGAHRYFGIDTKVQVLPPLCAAVVKLPAELTAP